jgi:ribose 5-phosphate isomerase B
MKVAVCSDEAYPIHRMIRTHLEELGHECVVFGPFEEGPELSWVQVAEEAALAVSSGECREGIFLCWSGTGISMAANKVPGIRAALCFDPETARAARQWNDANVLCLANRVLTEVTAREILSAWFDPELRPQGENAVGEMHELDQKYRTRPPESASK